jgi:hypothetical protein
MWSEIWRRDWGLEQALPAVHSDPVLRNPLRRAFHPSEQALPPAYRRAPNRWAGCSLK